MLNKEINEPGRILIGSTTLKGKKVKNLEQLKAKDEQLVKGRFNYHEIAGGTLSFVYKAYKGQPVVRYDLTDGEIYKIPLGVAKHLNNNVGRIEHEYLLDRNGKPSTMAHHRIRRCSFENLDFMDFEDLGNSVIEEVKITGLPSLTKRR